MAPRRATCCSSGRRPATSSRTRGRGARGGRALELDGGTQLLRLEGRAVTAPGRPPPLRLPAAGRDRQSATRLAQVGDVLGGREAEHERLREPARVAAGRDAAGVDARGVEPVDGAPSSRSTRACSSTRRPPIVCVIAARTRTPQRTLPGARERQRRRARRTGAAGVAGAARPSRSRTSGSSSAVAVQQVPGAGARLPRRRLDDVGLRPGRRAREERLAALVDDRRVRARRAARAARSRASPERRVRHVAAVELVHPARSGAARGERRRAARRPSLHGFARSASGSGVM